MTRTEKRKGRRHYETTVPVAVNIRSAWGAYPKSKRNTFFDCISHRFGKQRDVYFFYMFL